MPTISIEMFPGRTPEQKNDLVARVTQAVVGALAVNPEKVKVRLYEIQPWHSAEAGKLMATPPVVNIEFDMET